MLDLLLITVASLSVMAIALLGFMGHVKRRMHDRLDQIQELVERLDLVEQQLEDTRAYILGGDLERTLKIKQAIP